MIFIPAMSQKREARFWQKVDKSAECWIWTGTKRDGYGQFKTAFGMANAHRIAWELAYGRIPNGQQCLHRCDVRSCVNPAHLFLGTLHDNMRDRNTKGRQARGERSGRATITESVASQIKALKPNGKAPWGYCREIAARFGIKDRQVISNIFSGRTWGHL